jgi:hypothetical protein
MPGNVTSCFGSALAVGVIAAERVLLIPGDQNERPER